MKNYLNIKINQIRTAEIRGMDVSEEKEKFESMSDKQFLDYIEFVKNPNTIKSKLNATYFELNPKKDEPLRVLKVFYINKTDVKTISSGSIKEIISVVNQEIKNFSDRKYSVIIIGEAPLSSLSKTDISLYPDLDITYFEDINLNYFAMDSDLSPKYEAVSDEEKQEIMFYYKIKSERDFPWILTDEQIVMIYNWKPGTLLRIKRHEPEMSIVDVTLNYRIVVQQNAR